MRDRGDDEPDDPEQPVHGLHRAELALGARALEPVVELRRLEREQVDPRGDVEHAVERAPADELAEDTALLGLDRLHEVECDRDRHERGQRGQQGA